ncbi:MAG: S1C family serine protease [Myxococcota bacterium]
MLVLFCTMFGLGLAQADDPSAAPVPKDEPPVVVNLEPPPPEPSKGPQALADSVEVWMESVVLLLTGPAWCTGVLVDDKGTVATAYHCVASGQKTAVRTRSGDEFIGKTVAADPKNDIALISVEGISEVISPMAIRTTDPRQGDQVYGLGHPFAPASGRTLAMEGMLQWSVTAGIVSAVGPRLIQTDTALNPGNSGGPVVDEDGLIVGIASRKLSGDNVAFLSSSSNLLALQKSMVKPALLGGQFMLGLSSIAPADPNGAAGLALGIGAIVRDRIMIQGNLGLGAEGRSLALEQGHSWYPSFELTTALRQRFGRGTWSTAVDVGGGLMGTNGWFSSFDEVDYTWTLVPGIGEVTPEVFGRVSLGGVGIRMIYLPVGRGGISEDPLAAEVRAEENREGSPHYLLSLDIDVPGVFATF